MNISEIAIRTSKTSHARGRKTHILIFDAFLVAMEEIILAFTFGLMAICAQFNFRVRSNFLCFTSDPSMNLPFFVHVACSISAMKLSIPCQVVLHSSELILTL